MRPLDEADCLLLLKVDARFRDAEARLKQIEGFAQELVFPAINELRYAGNHLLRGLTADSKATREENFNKALNHCERAIFDSTEVGVIYCMEKAAKFEDDYRLIQIESALPNYVTTRKAFREAQALIETASADHDQRGAYADQCSDLFKKLRAILEEYGDARPSLNKQVRTRRSGFVQFVVSALIGIAALALGLMAGK